MAKRTYYVFVCGNQRPPGHPKGCCRDRGSLKVIDAFHEIIDRDQLYELVKVVTTASCLGPCAAGPTVCVFPDNVWYGPVKPEDVEEILSSHIKKGNPVTRLFTPPDAF